MFWLHAISAGTIRQREFPHLLARMIMPSCHAGSHASSFRKVRECHIPVSKEISTECDGHPELATQTVTGRPYSDVRRLR